MNARDDARVDQHKIEGNDGDKSQARKRVETTRHACLSQTIDGDKSQTRKRVETTRHACLSQTIDRDKKLAMMHSQAGQLL